jgi:hypothetical protein
VKRMTGPRGREYPANRAVPMFLAASESTLIHQPSTGPQAHVSNNNAAPPQRT